MDNIQGLNCQGDTFKVGIALLTAVSSSGGHCDITGPGLYAMPRLLCHIHSILRVCVVCMCSEFAKLFQRNLQKLLFCEKLDTRKKTVIVLHFIFTVPSKVVY